MMAMATWLQEYPTTEHGWVIYLETHGILYWIFIGLLAGWLAGKIARGRGFGCLTDIVLGLVGAVLGGASTARDPLQVFIDPLTPNTDYVAASGFVYPTSAAVPEPSTWAMMLVGFAGLGFAGWRARAHLALTPEPIA